MHKEVLSNVIKLKYTTMICSNKFGLIWYKSVEILFVITISLIRGLLGIIIIPLLDIISDFIYASMKVTFFSDFIWDSSSNFKGSSLLLLNPPRMAYWLQMTLCTRVLVNTTKIMKNHLFWGACFSINIWFQKKSSLLHPAPIKCFSGL